MAKVIALSLKHKTFSHKTEDRDILQEDLSRSIFVATTFVFRYRKLYIIFEETELKYKMN